MIPAGLICRFKVQECDLTGATLSGCDLLARDLAVAIHDANLRGCDLRKANLRALICRFLDLTGCDLRKAIPDCNSDCDLSGADFAGAKVNGAITAGAIGRAYARKKAKVKDHSLRRINGTIIAEGLGPLRDLVLHKMVPCGR